MPHAQSPEAPHAPGRAPTIDEIRAQFAALSGPTVLLDNAGGSQVPACVGEAVRRYFNESYVQVGADYDMSRRASANVRAAHEIVKTFLNAHDPGDPAGGAAQGNGLGEVILGPSSTALCHILANSYADARDNDPYTPRTEVVVSTLGHEANIGPWERLKHRGFIIRYWHPERDSDGVWRCRVSALRNLLSARTAVVAFPHVSNVLGEITEVNEVARFAHAYGARVAVDGVAYAPHHAPNVRSLNCDWYVYSTYKVMGPHMAAMFGSREALAEVPGPNHYFIPKDQVPYKFELGGVNHEGCAAINALGDYLRFLAGQPGDGPVDRALIERAFGVINRHESALQEQFLSYLRSRKERAIEIVGPSSGGPGRVCTISFVKRGDSSRRIALALNEQGLAVRYGNFYSKRLIEAMGLHPEEGVVRVSLLHYNTPAEVERLISAIDELI